MAFLIPPIIPPNLFPSTLASWDEAHRLEITPLAIGGNRLLRVLDRKIASPMRYRVMASSLASTKGHFRHFDLKTLASGVTAILVPSCEDGGEPLPNGLRNRIRLPGGKSNDAILFVIKQA